MAAAQARTKKNKKVKVKKKKRLENNKTLFKLLMPKSAYLEDIRIGEIDIPFLTLILVLLVFGLVMMYSASYAWAISDGMAPDYYFKRQLMMAGMGMVLLIAFSSRFLDYHLIKHPAVTYSIFIISIILMIIVHIPGIGGGKADADRWIYVGDLFSFQPSEVMKFAMIILFAHMMSANHSRIHNFFYGVLPYLLIMIFIAVLTMWQRHLSGTIIICCLALAMMFISGVRLKHFIPLCIFGMMAFALLIVFLFQTKKFDYINERIIGWWYTFDPANKDFTWQTRNSLIAIGSGGFFGLGLGNSRQKFLYLPESKNDFVFSIVCEELGFLGAVVVILLFLMLIFRGFKIASNAPDKYGMLLASGLVIQIGLQAFLNIAVVTNTIPNTGISLPFFSYGGSALIMQLAQMGIVLNISRQSIPNKGKPDADDAASEHEMQKLQEAKNRLKS